MLKRQFLILTIALLIPNYGWPADYYVSTVGTNNSTCGTELSPCASIGYAVGRLPSAGGDTIIVKDGTYTGQNSITAAFSNWTVIKAENPYQVKITNPGGEALGIFEAEDKHIIVEGFIFSNRHASYTCPNGREPNVLVHIENASFVIMRNNIFSGNNTPGNCNELLKINRAGIDNYPHEIEITGNLFYDRPSAAGTDMIDSVIPGELDITDNIFFERNSPSGHSFITIKRQAQSANAPGGTPRSPRFKFQRNVFLNWSGATDQAMLQLGEDGTPEYKPQISDALIENNLFVGNSSDNIGAVFQFKDSENITVRANTIVGNFPNYYSSGSTYAFAFRFETVMSDSVVRDVFAGNNIFSDPTGTMGPRFAGGSGTIEAASIILDHNIYYNGGLDPLDLDGSLPFSIKVPADDLDPIIADPLLPGQSSVVLPEYNETSDIFISGNTTIRREFERLVSDFATIPENSPAKDTANPSNMPGDDILGMARDLSPDLGAFEYGASDPYDPPDDPPTGDDDDDGGTLGDDDDDDPGDTGGDYNPFSDIKDDASLFTVLGGCGMSSYGSSGIEPFLFLLFVFTLFVIRLSKVKPE